MKSLNTKLVLSAFGLALLATPAFAQTPAPVQKPQHQSYRQQRPLEDYSVTPQVGTYPNGAIRSGSEENRESGAEDNLIRNY